jgi:glutathione peroxidase-family protein
MLTSRISSKTNSSSIPTSTARSRYAFRGVPQVIHFILQVNGDDAHPLYKFLKKEQGGTFFDAIKWNFTKFLVNRQGKVVARYGKELP